jgi:Zn-dependent peptidase ImmA (M78 family)/transcriptional regulator with XRE-family HTH domain
METENIEVNPAMVTLARESRGHTQTQAAKSLGINQGRLSKIEAGIGAPVSAELLEKMAREFHYPKTFFGLKRHLLGADISEIFHRKRQATAAKTLHQIYAEINVAIINVSPLLNSVEVEIDGAIPRHETDDCPPEKIAQMMRAYWKIAPGPIESMVGVIENAGGIVLPMDFRTPRIDALSRSLPNLPRFFFINSTKPGDRQRFTLAHELGHVIMHQWPQENIEDQADQFAAEFLMPKSEIKYQLAGIDLEKLVALKSYWKVSMGALLRRARDLGKITPSAYQNLWIRMSKQGFKTREPLEIPPEKPTLLNEIIELHKTELGYDSAELAQLMMLCEDEAEERYFRTAAGSKLRRIK